MYYVVEWDNGPILVNLLVTGDRVLASGSWNAMLAALRLLSGRA